MTRQMARWQTGQKVGYSVGAHAAIVCQTVSTFGRILPSLYTPTGYVPLSERGSRTGVVSNMVHLEIRNRDAVRVSVPLGFHI